jgi:hypothetical protein
MEPLFAAQSLETVSPTGKSLRQHRSNGWMKELFAQSRHGLTLWLERILI